jgi:hypothetical protein
LFVLQFILSTICTIVFSHEFFRTEGERHPFLWYPQRKQQQSRDYTHSTSQEEAEEEEDNEEEGAGRGGRGEGEEDEGKLLRAFRPSMARDCSTEHADSETCRYLVGAGAYVVRIQMADGEFIVVEIAPASEI